MMVTTKICEMQVISERYQSLRIVKDKYGSVLFEISDDTNPAGASYAQITVSKEDFEHMKRFFED